MITIEDATNLVNIISKDLDIPEHDKELKKRIEAQTVLYVLNQDYHFWYGDFERDDVKPDKANKQYIRGSPI